MGDFMSNPKLTPEQFITSLRTICRERIKGELNFWERDHGRDSAFLEVVSIINIYIAEFCDRPIEEKHEKH